MDILDASTRMAQSFSDLSSQLYSCGDDDGVWQQVVDLAVDTVPNCDRASIFKTARAHKPPVPIAASDEVALAVDRLQCEVGEGPSVEAAAGGTPVASNDLTGEMRWPRFSVRAIAQSPVRSVLSFPLSDQAGVSSISFYSSQPDAFDPTTVDAGSLFAAQARSFAVLAESVRKVVNLSEALTTSRTIGAAVGIIMLARKLTPEQAFDVLREASQRLHVKIRDLAQVVTETGELPHVPPGMERAPWARPRPEPVPHSVG